MHKLVLKLLVVLLGSVAFGVLVAVAPCYVFPLFGGNTRTWCGYKSEPTYFFELLATGVLAAAIALSWLLLLGRPSRGSKPRSGRPS
jgi:hypothetical protein